MGVKLSICPGNRKLVPETPKQAVEHAIEMGRVGSYLKLTPRCTPGSCIAKAEPLGAPFV
jgi:hypothetical protein